ncbi:uncharacterized protein [Pocillopora verrucosa]|uniref:uncharacterized protein isoform X2 n=1 Tax=Pocillopora verrucosa TaxID=203993 RepID=UPI0033401FE4
MQLSFMARFSRRFSSVYNLPILTLLASVLILRSDAGSMDCAPSLSVYRNEILARLPYVETNVTNNSYSDEGLLTTFLHLMLADCCRLSMKLIYNASSHDDADLHFPVIVNLEADHLMSSRKNLVPLLPQTGIAFLVLERSRSDYTWRIVKSLFATWPVLILILVLSLLAGIAAWSLEKWRNSDNFPPMFTKGVWEGFWWAFISITTVGYGDRYPKSVGGRLFAVLWILIGMCIISILTATLTSSMTTFSLEAKVKLPGTKVVVLVGSIEMVTGIQHQASLTRVKTAADIHEHLESGALMDAYLLAHFKRNHPSRTRKFKAQEVFQQKYLEYGVRVKDPKLAECLREKRFTQEAEWYEHAEILLQQSLLDEFENRDGNKVNLFDPDGVLYFPFLFTCLGVAALLLLTGGAWDLCRKINHRMKKKGRKGDFSITLARASLITDCINQDKMNDLERKIEDLNETFKSIKGGAIFVSPRYNMETTEIV